MGGDRWLRLPRIEPFTSVGVMSNQRPQGNAARFARWGEGGWESASAPLLNGLVSPV